MKKNIYLSDGYEVPRFPYACTIPMAHRPYGHWETDNRTQNTSKTAKVWPKVIAIIAIIILAALVLANVGLAERTGLLRASTKLTQGAESTAVPTQSDEFPSYWKMDSHWTKRVQECLVEWGYEVNIDGKFGRKTALAVKRFQLEHGFPVNGVVDADLAEFLGCKFTTPGLTLYYQEDLQKQSKRSDNGWLLYGASGGRPGFCHFGVFRQQANGHWKLVKSADCIFGDQSNGRFTPLGRMTVERKTTECHIFDDKEKKYNASCYYQLWIDKKHAIESILRWDANDEWDDTPLGSRSNDTGDIRVSYDLSEWLWENIPEGTLVIIDDRAWQPGDIN